MQEKRLEEHHVVCKVDDDHMQIMIKGKRTKRPRLITMTSSAENSGTVEEEEEEDDMMANCLILLAQGHHHHHLHTQKNSTSHSHHVAAPHNNNNGEKLYLYQCKTCNRCFSSFQALGGHRVSHKKIPKSNTDVTTTFVNEDDYGPTNTTLTLQLSNRAMYSSNHNSSTMTSTYKSNKVHECSICGAEFTSGQALGGHMRRHRSTSSLSMRSNTIRSPQTHDAKIHRNVLKLDLNLPAPEDDDDRESKFPFQSKDKVIAFSATSLVDRLPLLKFKSSHA